MGKLTRMLAPLALIAALLLVTLGTAPVEAQSSTPTPARPTATPARPRPTATPRRPRPTATPRRPRPTATPVPTATPRPIVWAPREVNASLKGSGATFPNPLYQAWIDVYKRVVPSVSISYQGVGSGQGIRDFIGYLVDFGGTDAALAESRVRSEAPDALHVPTVLGGVVPIFNVPGIESLRFSPETLSGIYQGSITKWNDGAIAADNPNVGLPDLDITVVYRSDSSGTTSIFTDYLSKVSGAWRDGIGAGTTVNWPTGIGAPGNPGVASTVKQTEGGIGYVELIFALANGLSYGSVKNAAGNYVQATLQSVTAAADGVSYPSSLVVSITNPAGGNAYPIAGFTYILVRSNTYKDLPKAQALTDFLYWGLTEGQGAANRLGYAPLPGELRQLAIRQLLKVTVDGKPALDAPVK